MKTFMTSALALALLEGTEIDRRLAERSAFPASAS